MSYGGSSMLATMIGFAIVIRKNISHNPIKKQLNLKSANE